MQLCDFKIVIGDSYIFFGRRKIWRPSPIFFQANCCVHFYINVGIGVYKFLYMQVFIFIIICGVLCTSIV